MPFNGASVIRGVSTRVAPSGWVIDRRAGFKASPPTRGEVKPFLRQFASALPHDNLAGLRLCVMRRRGVPLHRINAVLAETKIPLDSLERLAVDADERLVAALTR